MLGATPRHRNSDTRSAASEFRNCLSSCGATGPLVRRTNPARFHRHRDVKKRGCFRLPASALMTRIHSRVNRFSLYKHPWRRRSRHSSLLPT